MIFSDLASPAEASNERTRDWLGFAQGGNPVSTPDQVRGRLFPDHALVFLWSMIFSENRSPLFRIMLYGAAAFFPASMTSFGNASR